MALNSKYWTQHIRKACQEATAIPFFRGASLDWKMVSSIVANVLGIENVTIQATNVELLLEDVLINGFNSTQTTVLSVSVAPLQEQCFWILPQDTLNTLITLITGREGTGFGDKERLEGFYIFLLTQILLDFNTQSVFQDLKVSCYKFPDKVPHTPCFSIDISLNVEGQLFWGRLLIPKNLYQDITQHVTPATLTLPDSAIAQTPLELLCSIGSTHVSLTEWEQAHEGDLLLLDHCGVTEGRGRGSLMLDSSVLFDVRIKNNEAKLLRYAFHDEALPMYDDDDISDLTSENDNFDEEIPDLSADDLQDDDDDHYSDSSWENSTSSAQTNPEISTPTLPELSSAKKIPLKILVEVSRFTLSLDKVLQLAPGNVLALDTDPNLLVYLSTNGKRIAQGELVQIGEKMAVKITKTS